jgi:VRR-NUC domain
VTERELQDAIVEAAKLLGWMVFHPFDSRRSTAGWPDLTLVHRRRARLMFMELKSETGRVTHEQHAWIDALARAGADVRVVRPVDLDAVLEELQAA